MIKHCGGEGDKGEGPEGDFILDNRHSVAVEAVRQDYEKRAAQCRDEIFTWQRQSIWISRGRGITFLLAGAFVYGGLTGALPAAICYSSAGLFFVGFLLLVARDEAIKEATSVAQLRGEIQRVQLARLRCDWKQVPEFEVELPPEARATSRDLDLFGHASLYQLLCRARTPRGQELLRDWLLQPAQPTEIRQRNDAVARLAELADYREELDLCGRQLASSRSGPRAFLAWAEGPAWLAQRSWLNWSARLLTIAMVTGLACGLTGVITPYVVLLFCGAVAGVNLLLSVLFVGRVHEIFEQVDSKQHDVWHYVKLFESFEQLPDDMELLGQLRREPETAAATPRQALASLARIMKVAQMRHSSLFGVLHIVVQLMWLVDFHVLAWLETWQRKHGQQVREWFEAIGQLEALASLASLAHDHPTWQFGRIDPQASELEADQVGHPLLADCVRNGVRVGPRGTFLLVTGSNMSGKSTLLRAVGMNAVLAQAGAPVCASAWSMPPVEVATSMRIQDSLEDGVSSFMAELRRLKEIVDRAVELRNDPSRSLLFLLDEVLQGTNSVERHIAVMQVVKHLTDCDAMGAISTHDLELAASRELKPICRTVHFRETLPPGGGMTFDFRLRPGVATTTNAIKLLQLVGLGDGCHKASR